MNFTANFIFSESDVDCVKAGLADDQFDTQKYVLFQRSLNPSELDRRLGHDKPHFEIGDQSISGYDGIKDLSLSDNELTVVFDQLQPEIGNNLIVKLNASDGFDELVAALSVIFGDSFHRK